MANAQLKTKKTRGSVKEFINSIEEENRRRDSAAVADMMKKVTGAEPRMWGSSVVGFGDYHYKYESGRENDWFMMGFSPRKQALTLYFMSGVERYGKIIDRLGKVKTGKGCLYIKNLDDVDLKALRELMTVSAADLKKTTAK